MRPFEPRLALRLLLSFLFLLAADPARADDPAPSDPPPSDPPHTYDPYQGIEPDGRIPGILRPADLPNPERWRYIPEGRLKPGNVFQRFLVSSMIAPFVFYDSDVGVGFGVALVDIDFREQRRREFAGAFLSYTTEGQQNYTFVWRRWLHHIELPDGGVLQEERSLLRAAGGYERSLTRRFFGLGPNTHEDDETSYRDSVGFIELGLDLALPDPGDDLVLSLGASGEFHDLGDGHVEGEPNTKDVYPDLFGPADPSAIGSLQAGVRWDTRDSQVNPYRGWWVTGNVDAALVQGDGDVGAVWTLSGGKIFKLPGLFHRGGEPGEEHPPTDTVAASLRSQLSSGELPFFKLPALGGSQYERGYIAGRWRDDASWVLSLEYRFWLLPRGFPIPFTGNTIRVERFGAALFYEAGAVAGDFSSLFKSRVRSSYGFGLRASLERAAPFRVDIGFSGDGVNVAAGFGLSF
jgi:hypothetical protein